MGYRFSPTFVQNLLSKYDPRTKKLTLDNFIVASVQIKRLTGKLASHISNIIIICVLMTSGVKGANEIIGFKVSLFKRGQIFIFISSHVTQIVFCTFGTNTMRTRKTVQYSRHNGRGVSVSTGQPQCNMCRPLSRIRPRVIHSAIHSLTWFHYIVSLGEQVAC